jgi:hypothetical protein
MTIQWTFLPSLAQICFVVSEKKVKMWNSHRVQCQTMSSHGGHLEFQIGKRFTSLVQDHPMAIDVHWMILYQICVFGVDRKFNMASRANNVFWLVETLKISLSETTKPIE